jgi:hypothetical protein
MRVTGGATGIPWKGRAYIREKYPSALPLTLKQLDVLKGLAQSAPINPNKLSKKLKYAYSFVYTTLRELERRKIVSMHREKNEKGTLSRIYDLEIEGVLWILAEEMKTSNEWNHSLIGTLIERHRPKLPLVFGKWQYFREAGLEDLVLTRLKIAVDTHSAYPFQKGTGYYPWLEMEQQITRFFFLWDFYRGSNNPIKGFNFATWINALKNDKEIRAFVIQELEYEQKVLKKHLADVGSALSFIR